jgi:hypothetical protein
MEDLSSRQYLDGEEEGRRRGEKKRGEEEGRRRGEKEEGREEEGVSYEVVGRKIQK